MEDTRLPKYVMFGESVEGAGCVGQQEKGWVGCFLDDLIAFGINPDQWTTAAHDEGGRRRTAEQGAEHFMAKRNAVKKARAGLRHAVVCPNVTGMTKQRIPQSKGLVLVRSHLLTSQSGANLYPPGAWFADIIMYFSGIAFVLCCFFLVFILLLKPRPLVQSFFDMQAPR